MIGKEFGRYYLLCRF